MTNIRQGVTYIQQYLIRLFSLTELDTPTEPPMPKIYNTDGLSGELIIWLINFHSIENTEKMFCVLLSFFETESTTSNKSELNFFSYLQSQTKSFWGYSQIT